LNTGLAADLSLKTVSPQMMLIMNLAVGCRYVPPDSQLPYQL